MAQQYRVLQDCATHGTMKTRLISASLTQHDGCGACIHSTRLITPPRIGWAEYCDHRVSGNARPIFTNFCPRYLWPTGSGSILWRRCDFDVLPVLWMTSYLRIRQGSSTWPSSSLGLGYKRLVGTRNTRCGPMDSHYEPTFRTPRSGPTRSQWPCWMYRVAQNKISHRRICNISATSGLILKFLKLLNPDTSLNLTVYNVSTAP